VIEYRLSVLRIQTAASDNGLSRGGTEEVSIIGDIGVASFVFDGALVTCLMNAANDRIQIFPGILKETI
jgi:hypothetical protein